MTDQWKRDSVERARHAYVEQSRREARIRALAEAREPAQPIPEPEEIPDADDASVRRAMLT